LRCACVPLTSSILLFFSTDTSTSEIYTLSLHDALPIYGVEENERQILARLYAGADLPEAFFCAHDLLAISMMKVFRQRGIRRRTDRKSTRLNSSHVSISYAVFCLKKKKIENTLQT